MNYIHCASKGFKGLLEYLPHREYRESLLDGTSIYLNPYAINPLPIELFEDEDLAIIESKTKRKIKNGFLFSRRVENYRQRSK